MYNAKESFLDSVFASKPVLSDFPRGKQIRPSEGKDRNFENYGETGRQRLLSSLQMKAADYYKELQDVLDDYTPAELIKLVEVDDVKNAIEGIYEKYTTLSDDDNQVEKDLLEKGYKYFEDVLNIFEKVEDTVDFMERQGSLADKWFEGVDVTVAAGKYKEIAKFGDYLATFMPVTIVLAKASKGQIVEVTQTGLIHVELDDGLVIEVTEEDIIQGLRAGSQRVVSTETEKISLAITAASSDEITEILAMLDSYGVEFDVFSLSDTFAELDCSENSRRAVRDVVDYLHDVYPKTSIVLKEGYLKSASFGEVKCK